MKMIKVSEQIHNMMKDVITEANNSLYGSHGFFMNLYPNVQNPHKHHLSDGIEKLKEQNRKQYVELEERKAQTFLFKAERDKFEKEAMKAHYLSIELEKRNKELKQLKSELEMVKSELEEYYDLERQEKCSA